MPAREHDVNTAYILGVRPALHSWSDFHHATSLTALHKTCKQLLFKSCMAAACLQPVMHVQVGRASHRPALHCLARLPG
jgi:hypothetical protein